MPRGIIIFGPAGSGKTSLGRMVAQELNFPYFDIDDFIWRSDTPVPYTVMHTRAEKISGLMNAIAPHDHFCMAGSMSSFHEHFDPPVRPCRAADLRLCPAYRPRAPARTGAVRRAHPARRRHARRA